MPALKPEFRKLLEKLADNNVRFVVIGGIAMGLHGSDHGTLDVDVIYARDKENLEALVAAYRMFTLA